MRLAIVGAGLGGTNLIKAMKDLEGIEVAMVVDRNWDAPGIELAQRLGIAHANDIADIGKCRADAIVEATGVPAVIEALQASYGSSHKIIESDVAQVMMTIVDQQVLLSEKLNHQMEAVSHTTTQFETELDRISETVGILGMVSGQLNESTEASNVFIEKSDQMIGAVNKITNQIKILGLNANIEAARAGEHGRGFAVVASEVQKLSDDTARFAKEISDLLKSLSNENGKITSEVAKLDELSQNQRSVSSNVQSALTQLMEKTNLA
jgi:methyl-accepting chemotaxis protein